MAGFAAKLPTSLCEDSNRLSFRGAAGNEESRAALTTFRARFLASLSRKSVILSEAKNLH